MCIFNDLSGGGCYPSLVVRFNDGRDRIIKNVSHFSVYGEGVRVTVCNRGRVKTTELENVSYVSITYYKYKIVKGVATTC